MKRSFVILFFSLTTIAAVAQTDSSRLRISLLTCTPGAELYSVFGHNALRIVDSTAGTDIVYNFGTFNFDDPDFYTKFVMGRLPYFLSQESFPDFVYAYTYFNRGVKEQVLNLTADEKRKVQLLLFDNVREENKYYPYDFLYDNCSTRLRDIIFHSRTDSAYDPPPLYEGSRSFREQIHAYLDKAEMQWTALGIDLLLGSVIDKKMDVNQSMFLPDFLALGVSKASKGGRPVVQEELTVVPDRQSAAEASSFWQRPIVVLSFFSFLLLLPAAVRGQRRQSLQTFADKFMLILTGVLGSFLLFMWFGTDHRSCSNNLNLVWAMPFHLVVGLLPFSAKRWTSYYFRSCSVLMLALVVFMMVIPGWINTSLFPLILVMSYRMWMMGKMD